MAEEGNSESLSGSLSGLSVVEKKSEVIASVKTAERRAASPEEEEEEDTGETVKVNLPRKGQEAPLDETTTPKVMVHPIEVEEPPKPAKSVSFTKLYQDENQKPEMVVAEHGFVESASREPLPPKDIPDGKASGREARIAYITQREIWKLNEAQERFPAKAYVCRFCGLSYAYMNTLKAHERVHDVQEPYRCGKCGMSFHFASELDYHAKSHKEQRQYKCKCTRSFNLYTDLIGHKCELDAWLGDDRETTPEPIHAPLQGTTSALDNRPQAQPLYRYPDSRRKPYICQYCGKSYAESRELKYHMYSHRGERAFNVRSTSYAQCLPDDKIWKSDLDYYDWD